jgi:toxin ParE1/3/4
MIQVYRLPRVASDLFEIWEFIARDNPAAADRVLNRIELKIDMLRRHPLSGVHRPEIDDGVRIAVSGSYVILYRASKKTLQFCALCTAPGTCLPLT